MSIALADALENVELEEGRTYRCEVHGRQVEVRVLTNPPTSTGLLAEDAMLDSNDARSRLEDIRILKDGWLDGKGVEPSRMGLDWFAKTFGATIPMTCQCRLSIQPRRGAFNSNGVSANTNCRWKSISPITPGPGIVSTCGRNRTTRETSTLISMRSGNGWSMRLANWQGNGDERQHAAAASGPPQFLSAGATYFCALLALRSRWKTYLVNSVWRIRPKARSRVCGS
jgi:hypothetical protein